jgi:hypothetical protein
MSKNDLIKHEPTIMEIVQQIVGSPNARDQVEVMKELLAMKRAEEDREARRAYFKALHDAQAKIAVTKDGSIVVKNEVRSRYATLEQLDIVLRPLMDEHGFAFDMTELGIKDGMREFGGTLKHLQGHEETKCVNLPLDKSDFRSGVQSEGSTISYARRQLYKLHFNIVERERGESPENVETIDAEQVKDLETVIADVGANKKLFLEYFRIEKVADLKKADLRRAIDLLEKRRKANENPPV